MQDASSAKQQKECVYSMGVERGLVIQESVLCPSPLRGRIHYTDHENPLLPSQMRWRKKWGSWS